MYINATGYYIPEERVDNQHFLELNGLTSEWIEQRTGIRTRSKAKPEENINTMSLEALRNALPKLPYDITEVDLIISASYSPYDTVATAAHKAQFEYQITNAKALYLSSACSSFLNALEVAEAAEILDGRIKNNLYDLSLEIASNMISMGKGISIVAARDEAIEAIKSKKAYNKFMEFVSYQKGDIESMVISDKKIEIAATKSGIITFIDAYKVSEVSCKLGSGRLTKDDVIDSTVGVFLNKQVGDSVQVGDIICTIYYNKVKDDFDIAKAFTIQ